MEPYYPCNWLSFVNQKNGKNKKLKFLFEVCLKLYLLFLMYNFSKQMIGIIYAYPQNMQTTKISST